MDPDLDLFDDILPKPALTNARAGGKFQPKAKPWPKKVASVPVPSILPSNAKEKSDTISQTSLDTTNSLQPVDITDEKLTGLIGSLSSSALIGTKEPLKENDEKAKSVEESGNPLAQLIAGSGDSGLRDPACSTSDMVGVKEPQKDNEDSEIAISDCNGDQKSSLLKSAGVAGSLGFDSDLLDDILPKPHTCNSRAGGKFKPTAKPRQRNENKPAAKPRQRNENPAPVFSSELVASAVPNTAMEKVAGLASTVLDNTVSVESSGVEDGRLTNPVCESVMESVGTKEPGRNNRDVILCPPDILATVSREKDPKGKSNFPMQNSVDSSAFMKCDVVVTDSASPNEAAVQVDHGRSTLEESGAFPDLQSPGVLPPDAMDSVMPPPPNAQLVPSETINIYGGSIAAFPSDNIDDSSFTRLGDFIPPDPRTSEIRINQEPKTLTETSRSDNVADNHQEDVSDVLEKETSSSRKPARKAKKVSLAGDMNEHDKSSRQPRKQPAAPQLGDEPEDEAHGHGGFPSDNIDDDSSSHLGNFISADPCISEFQVDQNQKDFTESNCSTDANAVHLEDVPVVLEKESSKSRKRKVSSAPNCSQKSKKSSLASDVNEGKKSLRQLRKRAAGLPVVAEPDDEAHDNGGLPVEPRSSSVDEEDNDYEPRGDEESDDEYRVETTSRKRQASKKSKEPVAEKEKPVRKRKRSYDSPEQSTQEPRKKFSHSTRRNKKYVNKDLLNMPEDEIDFKRLPIRDIILFAEYKERLAMKEAAASETPPNHQSSDNPFHGEYSHNEEDGFASEQDRSYDDDQTSVRTQASSSLFNHQSFMDRAPNSRWSKQDTELFYEGIQQFGTDLSMIQQLFPGRTRHQVKLKYKKEERQHPLRVNEALSSRPKDHSYFEKLIEQLQEVAANQEEQESYKDDLVDMSGEEDAELNAETNDEVMKPKQDKDVGVEEVQEENVAEDHHGPLKSGDSDEDGDIWSSYRSEF